MKVTLIAAIWSFGLVVEFSGCAATRADVQIENALPEKSTATYKIATASPGGGFALYAPPLIKAVAEKSGIKLLPVATTGSVENIRLLRDNELSIALLNMGPAYEAWHGIEQWSGTFFTGMRALTPMYETPFHVIALKSSQIKSAKQLSGKRIGVGPARATAEDYFRGLMSALKIDATLVNASPTQHVEQLLKGEIDAFWFGAGVPIPAFVEIQKRVDAVVFGLNETEVTAYRKRFPYFSAYKVPANSYSDQVTPISTVAVWNFVVARSDFPEADAYRLTRSILSSTGELAGAYAAASASRAENAAANTFMTFHPGAIRAYGEFKEKPIRLSP